MRPINAGSGLERRSSRAAVSIDVHHHFNPTLKDNDGNPWSVQMALEELDRNSIASAIASLGPVNDSGSPARPRRVREWNELGARICLDHPGRFGLFASLPLPDIELAVAEIAYAYDVLGADGIGLSTNEGDIWLGDERNGPIFAELNRRKAVVFVHPAPTSQCGAVSRAYGGDQISPPWLEFPMNTARAVLGVLAKGVTRRFPDIRFIFAHGGGTMPFLLGRIAGFIGWRTVGPERLKSIFPDGVYTEFGKLYFECAQAYAPETMDLLRKVVPASHLLFGSDFSYFPISQSAAEFSALGLDGDTERAIGGGNAAALFPRFKNLKS
jgi:predicted TIM-barrel fold metal-dependent hydrolase